MPMSPPETTSLGELADDLAELHREQRAADGAHELAGALASMPRISSGACSLSTLVRASAMLSGDRLGELRPDRHGLPSTHCLRGDQRGVDGELADRGDLVEPEGRDVERLVELRALAPG